MKKNKIDWQENANKINDGLMVAMLIEKAETASEAIKIAWRFAKKHPWIWSKVLNTFQVEEYDLLQEEPRADFEIPQEGGKELAFVYGPSIEGPVFSNRVVKYHKRKGSSKKRRTCWNHQRKERRGTLGTSWETDMSNEEYDLREKLWEKISEVRNKIWGLEIELVSIPGAIINFHEYWGIKNARSTTLNNGKFITFIDFSQYLPYFPCADAMKRVGEIYAELKKLQIQLPRLEKREATAWPVIKKRKVKKFFFEYTESWWEQGTKFEPTVELELENGFSKESESFESPNSNFQNSKESEIVYSTAKTKTNVFEEVILEGSYFDEGDVLSEFDQGLQEEYLEECGIGGAGSTRFPNLDEYDMLDSGHHPNRFGGYGDFTELELETFLGAEDSVVVETRFPDSFSIGVQDKFQKMIEKS